MVEFYYPETLNEALELRSRTGALPLTGGTDLMVRYENWSSLPPRFPGSIMALKQLNELHYIREEDDCLCIGGATAMNRILEDPRIPEALALALDEIAAPSLRNLASLAGNIQNASPAADSLPPLIVMDASVRLVSSAGSRDLPVQEFITAPGRTVLQQDELIESVRIPLSFVRQADARQAEKSTIVYRKVGTRKANALSKLSVCFFAHCEDGEVKDIRMALGAVAATVVRLQKAEEKLKGISCGELETVWKSVKRDFEKAVRPIDDQRSTAFYRKRTALRLLDDFISRLQDQPSA